MKNPIKALILLSILALPFSSKAYFLHKQFTLAGYGTYNCEIYIPDGTTGNLPIVVYIPGMGESTTNPNDLYVFGPLHFIRDAGWSPNFVVAGIQPFNGGPAPYNFISNAMDSLFRNPAYHVDQNRWYLTGLSYGAAAIFGYINASPNNTFKYPTAIVPFSYRNYAQCGDYNLGTDFLCNTDLRYGNIPSWGFAGSTDAPHYGPMRRFFQLMQQSGYNARFTTYSGGHCCWNTYYNPSYTQNINGVNMSIYQWMLQYPFATLAVTWGYFDYNKTLQQLRWSTESETDNDHFEVEESEDGVTWTTLGTVNSQAPNGNSSSVLEYTFTL